MVKKKKKKKNPSASARDVRIAGSIPGLGRSPSMAAYSSGLAGRIPQTEELGENPMDRWAIARRVRESWRQLNRFSVLARQKLCWGGGSQDHP